MVYDHLLQPVAELEIERFIQTEFCPVVIDGLRGYLRILVVG